MQKDFSQGPSRPCDDPDLPRSAVRWGLIRVNRSGLESHKEIISIREAQDVVVKMLYRSRGASYQNIFGLSKLPFV